MSNKEYKLFLEFTAFSVAIVQCDEKNIRTTFMGELIERHNKICKLIKKENK